MVAAAQKKADSNNIVSPTSIDDCGLPIDSLKAVTIPKKAQQSPANCVLPMDSPGTNQWAPTVVRKGMVYRKMTDLDALVNSNPQ